MRARCGLSKEALWIRVLLWALILACHDVSGFILDRRPGRSETTTASSSQHHMASPLKIESPTDNTLDDDVEEERPHNVAFCAPLLDYGYPRAVEDLRATARQSDDTGENSRQMEKKPILLYLPGFDGTYICPFMQFPELGTEFEVWCMVVGMGDRSTYNEIKAMILDFVKNDLSVDEDETATPSETSATTTTSAIDESGNETASEKNSGGLFAGWFSGSSSSSGGNTKRSIDQGRPLYIAGESFGGVLALDVARTLLKERRDDVNYKSAKNATEANEMDTSNPVNLQGLVLINPATCYERSQLAVKGPQVATMPNALYLMGLFSQLLPLFTDEYSVEQLLLMLQSKALPSVIDDPPREAYMGRVALSLPFKLEFMPPSTLSWRLEEWLQTGATMARDLSFQLFPKFRTLIVVGENDKTLPSIAEAERLANRVMLASQTQIHVVEGAGHASTCGSRLDLAAVMRNCFVELQSKDKPKIKRKKKDADSSKASVNPKRTSMKPEAQEGEGPFFGMEERYDKAPIGLNPLLYWSKSNYQRVRTKVEQRQITEPSSKEQVDYKTTKYSVNK